MANMNGYIQIAVGLLIGIAILGPFHDVKQNVTETASLPASTVSLLNFIEILLPFGLIAWGAVELFRRKRGAHG